MGTLRTKPTGWLFTALIVAHFGVGSGMVVAQSPQRALVVVSTQSQADCVSCIGGSHVQVEAMFVGGANSGRSFNYRMCEERILRLLDFRLLVASKIEIRPRVGFWCERMAAANPKGKVCRVSEESRCRGDAVETRVRQINEIHRVLVSALPQYRDKFDANLESELQRLKRLQVGLVSLAIRE